MTLPQSHLVIVVVQSKRDSRLRLTGCLECSFVPLNFVRACIWHIQHITGFTDYVKSPDDISCSKHLGFDGWSCFAFLSISDIYWYHHIAANTPFTHLCSTDLRSCLLKYLKYRNTWSVCCWTLGTASFVYMKYAKVVIRGLRLFQVSPTKNTFLFVDFRDYHFVTIILTVLLLHRFS